MTVAKDRVVSVHKYYSYFRGKRENAFFKTVNPCPFGGSLLERDLDASGELSYLLPKLVLGQATQSLVL